MNRVFARTRPFDPAHVDVLSRDFETLFLDRAFPRRAAWERISAPARTGKPALRLYREMAQQEPEAVLFIQGLRPVLVGPLRPDGSIEDLAVDWCIADPGLRWAFICSHEVGMMGGQAYVEDYDPELELGRRPGSE